MKGQLKNWPCLFCKKCWEHLFSQHCDQASEGDALTSSVLQDIKSNKFKNSDCFFKWSMFSFQTMYICVFEENVYSLGAEITAVVNTLIWMLGTKLMSSAPAIGKGPLNHWTISPVAEIFSFLRRQYLLHDNCIRKYMTCFIFTYFKYALLFIIQLWYTHTIKKISSIHWRWIFKVFSKIQIQRWLQKISQDISHIHIWCDISIIWVYT